MVSGCRSGAKTEIGKTDHNEARATARQRTEVIDLFCGSGTIGDGHEGNGSGKNPGCDAHESPRGMDAAKTNSSNWAESSDSGWHCFQAPQGRKNQEP